MFNVCILMSTYNPTIYIVDQIKSILNQRDCHIDIYIRDDGSTDVSYLKEISMYCKKIYYEDNLGVSKSIHNLVNKIIDLDEIYDFYAFADQDDVWLEEKLRKAIYCIKDFNQAHPALYYSNLRVVNTNLEGNRNLFKSGIVKTTKEQALAQIFTFGCTCVFNRKCLLVFGLTNIGDLPFDNVILIESVFLGKTYYDEIPYILYRQHGENVSGQKEFGIKKLLQDLINFQL